MEVKAMDINLKFNTVTVTLLTAIFSATVLAAGTENFKVVSLPTKYEIESYAYAVSADGSVVVGLSSCDRGDEGEEAFRWQNGQITALEALPKGTGYCCARGVSADGSIIVGESTCDSGIQAFIWQDGMMVGLGSLTEGFDDLSYATAVSANGKVVVGYSYISYGNKYCKG
jgi:probable HAF family extracellular repeat protein